jgi:hypothetical protein
VQGISDQSQAAGKNAARNLNEGQDPVRPDGDSNSLIIGFI